jgi:hypothetical protein
VNVSHKVPFSANRIVPNPHPDPRRQSRAGGRYVRLSVGVSTEVPPLATFILTVLGMVSLSSTPEPMGRAQERN